MNISGKISTHWRSIEVGYLAERGSDFIKPL